MAQTIGGKASQKESSSSNLAATMPADVRKANLLKIRAEKMARSNNGPSHKHRQQDVDELVMILMEAGGGSLMRGWRRELDQYGNLSIDFPDFCQVADRLAYTGDAHLLFGGDGDFSNLTLEELVPREGALMERFKLWVRDTFGSPAQFFEQLDSSKKGKASQDAFINFLVLHNFPCEPAEVAEIFECIDVAAAGTVMAEDVIFLEVDPKTREYELFKSKMNQMREWKQQVAQEYINQSKAAKAEGASSRWAPRPWQWKTFDALPQVVCHRRHQQRLETFRKGEEARQAFLAHIKNKHGNEVRAMRNVLDQNGDYSFSLLELRRYCRKVDLNIKVVALWEVLKRDDDPNVSLEEFCTERGVALAGFRRWCQKCLGSCVAVWDHEEAVAARKKQEAKGWASDKKMMFSPFSRTLQALGWPEATNKEMRSLVLTSLDLIGCGVVERRDLEWLDKWRAPEWLFAEPDPVAWDEFKGLLVAQYKHPLRAWRMCLDTDNSNRISWSEFLAASKKVRFDGNTGAAWRVLDGDASGVITMREYDPPSAELLESFKDWADTNFGSVKLCFNTLDGDHSGSVTFPEFKRACHKLKWGGDVRMLFDCLDVDSGGDAVTGKRALSLDELEFMDSWHIEPTKEELEAAIAEAQPEPVRKPSSAKPQDMPKRAEPSPKRAGSAAEIGPSRRNSKPRSSIDASLEPRRSMGARQPSEINSVVRMSKTNGAMKASASAPNLECFSAAHRFWPQTIGGGKHPMVNSGQTYVWHHWRGKPFQVVLPSVKASKTAPAQPPTTSVAE